MSGKSIVWGEWIRNTLLYEYGDVCATYEMDCAGQVRVIDELVTSLARHGGDLAANVANSQVQIPDKAGVDRDLYAMFRHSLNIDLVRLRMVFPRHRYCPQFELYARHFGDRRKVRAMLYARDVDGLNRALNAIRREARTPKFKRVMDNHGRGPRKNANGAFNYVRALFHRYPGLRAIELDLTYQREFEVTERNLLAKKKEGLKDPITAKMVQCHREAFLDYLRYRYPTMVGFVWMLQHSAYKSFHTRWIIFLDGHEFETDESIGHAMGTYWRYDITSQRGSYWCLNGQKKNPKRGLLGYGKIDDYDTGRHISLERQVRCLAWADYFIRLDIRGIDRIFGKGVMPKPVSTRSGWLGSSVVYTPSGQPVQLEFSGPTAL